MKKALFLILLTATVTYLAITNPNQEAFSEFLQDHIHEYVSQRTGLSTTLTRLGQKIFAPNGVDMSEVSDRHNYLVCSVHTIPTSMVNLELVGFRDEEEIKFLGIAGRFIPLNLREK